MSTPIPPPLRAAAGLAAVAIDSARKLPEQLVGLPVLAVSAALQVSLRAQQRYAELVARGDEVLSQLRGLEESPPWARFDDEPGAAARPVSAFDAPRPGPPEEVPLDELAADQLGGGEPETDLLADAEARLDGGPVLEPDGVAATEAEAGGLDVGEVPLGDTAPGADLPAGEVTGLAEDAEAVRDALAAAEADRAPDEPAAAPRDDSTAGGAGGPADDPTAGLDGYLAVEPPIARYDELSIPQLRGRLRSLSEAQIEELVAYERATTARPAYLTMLENRLVTLRSR